MYLIPFKIASRIAILNLVLIFITQYALAQKSNTPLVNEIKVMGRLDKNQVLLRWAPTSPSAWLKANKYGYTLERFTVARNGILLATPERKEIVSNALLPDELNSWQQLVEQNDYAAILAQALYGEGFVVEEMQGGLAQIVNKAREIDQRFSFALFAADMNFEAAKKAALGYVDTEIMLNEDYLYRIKSNVPQDILKITPGVFSIKIKDSDPLPKPVDLFAVSQDKNILLTWEYELFKSVFTSYYLERSENGTDFKKLSDVPLVNLNDKPEAPAKRMFYIDTLSQNNKKYYYRVQGISPFGEVSPYSEIVVGSGIKKLEEVPHIDRHDFDSNGNVILKWSFKEEAEKQLQSFEVNWAATEKGPYKRIKENIAPNLRETIISEPEPSNYYSITAVGKGNQRTTSFISYVQTIDSIPPSRPVGLTGIVDTLGIVKLKWIPNKEKDLLGYRVFRGNLSGEEFSQLSISPITNTAFVDTVQLKSLNTKVFYKIVAVDQRFNMSEYSDAYALTKPDVVPPSAPLFSAYKVTDTGIKLNWINSTSTDVESHKLYRQRTNEQEKGWFPIFETDTITSFIDKTALAGTQYRYAIFAQDQAGLQSAPSAPITATNKIDTKVALIKGFKVFEDRAAYKIDISWKQLPKDITEILIYKSKKGAPPVLWKQMPNAMNKITDTAISPGNTYVYQIKVITNQGNHSQLLTREVNY